MESIRFIDKLAAEIVKEHQHNFASVVVVLPNKRARLFLLESLKKTTTTTFFAPQIISVEDLIASLSKINVLDSIELVLEFYEVYKQITSLTEQQDFEQFSNWAKMLLQDFNEIDRYLLNPAYVFDYLKDIDVINHWSVQTEDQTPLINNYLTFWNKLPSYYNALQKHLLQLNCGYQGMAYRLAVEKLDAFIDTNTKTYYFAGFNALNKAEEHIFKQLLKNGMAKVFWDTDEWFLNDFDHGAGYFARKIKQNWSYYKTHPYEWIVNEFAQKKNIEIISTPKSVGQAKIVGSIVEQLAENNKSIQNTAVVLSEENLLIPVLYALPNTVPALNITMGYDSKSNPVQLFFAKLFKMHVNALNRGGTKAVFYHKEVLDVFSHPLIAHLAQTKKVVDEINKRNFSFFDFSKLETYQNANDVLQLITLPWVEDSLSIIEKLMQLIFKLRAFLKENNDDVSLTFLHAFYKVIVQLKNYQLKYQVITSPQQLVTIYKQIADLAEVSFEGEPLEGLQIMGVLESRVLDFENVIITSVNEGKFPAGKTMNSFIPHDVKVELGLPTFKEKDAIYTYHFYHLLLRAKNIYLLYNSDSEGLDAGEKSRFITQLLLDPHVKHTIKVSNYFAQTPKTINQLLNVAKSPLLQNRLKEIATGNGFSPSAISNYIRNPFQFYMQRVLGVREVDEVEENIALNTLGTIIHGALESMYLPFVGQQLTLQNIESLFDIYENEILKQFEINFSDTKEKQGKNLLAFEVAKRNIYHFLMLEKQLLEAGDVVEIVGLEQRLSAELQHSQLPYHVTISGIADRIEVRNGILRIVDYKTGKVELNQVQISQIEGLTKDIKFEKALQLLLYGFMYYDKTNLPIQAGIYSFKNRKSGYLMFGIKQDKQLFDVMTKEMLLEFKEELSIIIAEILNSQIAFIEQEN